MSYFGKSSQKKSSEDNTIVPINSEHDLAFQDLTDTSYSKKSSSKEDGENECEPQVGGPYFKYPQHVDRDVERERTVKTESGELGVVEEVKEVEDENNEKAEANEAQVLDNEKAKNLENVNERNPEKEREEEEEEEEERIMEQERREQERQKRATRTTREWNEMYANMELEEQLEDMIGRHDKTQGMEASNERD
ncbi:hypothetical protein RFI_10162, partial [Reticulomyxa filosa]